MPVDRKNRLWTQGFLGKTPTRYPANTKITREPPIHINWMDPGTSNKDGMIETTKLIPNQDKTEYHSMIRKQ